MSAAKDELDRQNEMTIAKMNDWATKVGQCRGKIDEIRRKEEQGTAVADVDEVLEEIESGLFETSTAIHNAANDLDRLDNFFKFQRSNLEVRKYAFDSWPASRYVDRMLWVSTVLISLGGGAFATGMALTDGDLFVSLIAPGFFWIVGVCLLIKSLRRLKEVDHQKMEFYRKEFGLEKDLPSQANGD